MWSLTQIHFVLKQIEHFIEPEPSTPVVDSLDSRDRDDVLERANHFVPTRAQSNMETLLEANPQDPQLCARVFDRLSGFYDAGLLVQRAPTPEDSQPNWWVTDLFWKGNVFHLDSHDQIRATHIIATQSPLQTQKAAAMALLSSLGLADLVSNPEAEAYMMKPTATTAYVLVSSLPALWIGEHVHHTQRLVNKCFAF